MFLEIATEILSFLFKKKTEIFFQTQHAGSQFTLAETASIDYLQKTFPELKEKIIPVFRNSETKFKQLSKTILLHLHPLIVI